MKTKEEQSAYARERYTKPEIRARILATSKVRDAKPEVKATKKARASTPEGKASHRESSKMWEATEEGKAYKKATLLQRRCKNVGISVEYYNSLPKECSFPGCTSKKPGGRGDWHLDHNKITGEFRGLLCYECNLHKVGNHTLETSLALTTYLRKRVVQQIQNL